MRHVKFLFFIAHFFDSSPPILKTTPQNPPGDLKERNNNFKLGIKKKSGVPLKAS
jgi:hypothetical protein